MNRNCSFTKYAIYLLLLYNLFQQNDAALSNIDVSMPWNWAKVTALMTSLHTYYDVSAFNASYGHFLDVGVRLHTY